MDNELPGSESGASRVEAVQTDYARAPTPPGGTQTVTTPPARSGRSVGTGPSMPPSPPPGSSARAPESHGPGGGDASGDLGEATRLMCAAAYLESTFAQDVVDEIVHERHRSVQIPTGVDIAAVVQHCLAACRQKIVRDLLLTADIALTLVLLAVTRSSDSLLLGFLIAWGVVLWDMWSASHLVVKRLNPASFRSHVPPAPSDPQLVRRIEELARDQRGNLTVYSGFLPFSAAGVKVGGWSFLIDLSRGADELADEPSTPSEIAVAELYEDVERALNRLDMHNLEIRDRLFVSGSDLQEDRVLLPNRLGPPLAWVDPRVVGHYMVSPTHRIRHYRCIEIVDWGGELVLSLFLRFGISNGRLFCELNKFVLVPLKEDLHRLNGIGGGIRPRHVFSMVVRSALGTPGLSLRAPKIVLRPFAGDVAQSGRTREVEKDPYFDFGAAETALDRVRSTRYRRYFQLLDKEMYDKVLERTVLDSVSETLERHGIDTAEIAEKRASIVNQTIMMKDSFVNNLAIGNRAKILNSIPRPGGGEGAPPVPPS
jgi:hypothetical protein